MDTKDFFEKMGDTVNRAAEVTGHTAKVVAEITKLNYDNVRQRDAMRKAYLAIGKTYVQMKGGDPDEEMADNVKAVYAAQANIGANKARIADLKADLRGEGEDEAAEAAAEAPADDEEDDAE